MLGFKEQIKTEWDRLRSGVLRNFIRAYEQQHKNQNEVPPSPSKPLRKGPVEEPPPETPNQPKNTPVEEPPREL